MRNKTVKVLTPLSPNQYHHFNKVFLIFSMSISILLLKIELQAVVVEQKKIIRIYSRPMLLELLRLYVRIAVAILTSSKSKALALCSYLILAN